MVLNKDCIRDVLIYIEQHCVYYKDKGNARQLHEVGLKELSEDAKLSQYPYDDIHYTIQKLFEGDYIQGYYIPKNDPHTFKVASIKSLSLKGHDLLDNIKPEPVWEKTKNILQKVGDFSLGVMSQVAGETMAAYTKSIMRLS